MKFRYLVYAVCVKKSGSFSKAARSLYISQPALSSSIKKLEAELGYSIFERSSNGIALTKKAELFFKQVEPLVEQFSLIENQYSAPFPCIHISSFDSSIIADIFLNQLEKHGFKDCNRYCLHETDFGTLRRNVEDGISAIGLIYVNECMLPDIIRSLRYSNLKYKSIGKGPFYALSSKTSPFKEQYLEDPDRLSKWTLVSHYINLFDEDMCNIFETKVNIENHSFKNVIQASTCRTKHQILSRIPDSVTFACHTPPNVMERYDLTETPIAKFGQLEYGYVYLPGYRLSGFEKDLIRELKSLLAQEY